VVPPTKAVEVPYRNVLNAQESSHFGRFRFRVRLSHKSPGANVRRQMSRSKDFWEGSETNRSPGNGLVWAAADICDSLAWKQQPRSSAVNP
jgi:hypothetical protein